MRICLPLGCALALSAAVPAGAQSIHWRNVVTLYGDNTEFFTPYREGETILGGQFTSAAMVRVAPKYAVRVGVLGDVRFGSTEFLDRVRPVLAFRYQSGASLGVVGTLEPGRRHGFLDALAVSTLELTRPIEYGLQWLERRSWLDAEAFVNWQALNTETQREVFDYGWVLKVRPLPQLTLESQMHGLHHGGQLYSAGVPVTNNRASALGVTLADSVPVIGRASVAVYRLRSAGNIDPDAPSERPTRGRGTLVRAGVEPAAGLEVFGLHFRGRDFLAQEGDANYGPVGVDPDFYRARRRYLELGLVRRATLEGGVQLDAEFRLHRIDDEPSLAIRGTSWEYSYRLVLRTPFSILIRR